MSLCSDEIGVRLGTSSDLNFVISTWLRSYRGDSQFARPIRTKIYYAHHHKIVESIVRRREVDVLIAYPKKENPDTIIGYLVIERAEPAVLHFVYVKRDWRKFGIARAMLKASELDPNNCVYTHRTFQGEFIFEKFPGLTYNPYLL